MRSTDFQFPHPSDINRRDVLQGAVAIGAVGFGGFSAAAPTAIALQTSQASKPMTAYIGTATSRVDGRDKVTGRGKIRR